MQDPWTGAWERLRVPKEEADYRQRREIPPRPSYWGEAEAREWRRKLREEKERVEREMGERIEWRVNKMRRKEFREDPGTPLHQMEFSCGVMARTMRPWPYWKEKRDRLEIRTLWPVGRVCGTLLRRICF